jgi:mono/diheme cytochrome c family protein
MRHSILFIVLLCLPLLGQEHAGKPIYQKYCSQCHGEAGDGKGYAHDFVLPRPRDFTTGTFRFRTTSNESLPDKADLVRVIKNGIYGTSMPSFAVIGDKGISDVADYVTTFYQSWIDQGKEDGTYPAETLKIGNPPSVTDAMIAEGKQEYIKNQCADCHGHDGKADGPSSPTLVDDYDTPMRAANLSAPWRFRSGPTLTDIYKAFSTGISGTPMPSYRAALDDNKRWALAAYVDSLAPDTEPNPSAQVVGKSISGDLPDSVDHELWDQAQEAYFPLSGQIIWDPVNIDPTVHNVRVRVLHTAKKLPCACSGTTPVFLLKARPHPAVPMRMKTTAGAMRKTRTMAGARKKTTRPPR